MGAEAQHRSQGPTIEEIKRAFPLRKVAQMCGIDLPKDGVKFKSPFRPDNNPSCTVHGEIYRDWGRDETLDSIGFYAAANSMFNREAVRALADKMDFSPVRSAPMKKGEIVWPDELPYDVELLKTVSQVRGIPVVGIGFAFAYLRTMAFAEVCGERCWILRDRSRRGFEARRIDGLPFPPVGSLSERKSHARGSGVKAWPMGLLPPGYSDATLSRVDPTVLMVEGGPDYLAACYIATLHPKWAVLPVGMLGKASDISEAAKPHFLGRRVVIAGHGDAGERIAKWAQQIADAGARSVKVFKLGALDLNDIVKTRPEEVTALAQSMGVLP